MQGPAGAQRPLPAGVVRPPAPGGGPAASPGRGRVPAALTSPVQASVTAAGAGPSRSPTRPAGSCGRACASSGSARRRRSLQHSVMRGRLRSGGPPMCSVTFPTAASRAGRAICSPTAARGRSGSARRPGRTCGAGPDDESVRGRDATLRPLPVPVPRPPGRLGRLPGVGASPDRTGELGHAARDRAVPGPGMFRGFPAPPTVAPEARQAMEGLGGGIRSTLTNGKNFGESGGRAG